jgi:hypothetical protein
MGWDRYHCKPIAVISSAVFSAGSISKAYSDKNIESAGQTAYR